MNDSNRQHAAEAGEWADRARQALEQGNPIQAVDLAACGLNLARPVEDQPPFRNFHDPNPHAKDYKFRFAFKNTPYYGAYMTDLIKNHVEVEPGLVGKSLRATPELIEDSFREFRQELADLKADKPIIFAFGVKVHELLFWYLDRGEYTHLIKLGHYSDQIGKEDYRTEVISRIEAAGLFASDRKGDVHMTEKHWDVYVSYKNNPDGEVALNLVEALEKAGLKCWIAPRDVTATVQQMRVLGLSDSGWAGALHFAIRYSRVMVVVISDAAMKDGKQLQKEIDVGDKSNIKFFPVLLENVPLRDSFDLHLGREQFINCFSGSGGQRFLNVASEISGFLGVAAIARKPAEPASSPSDAAANEELEGIELFRVKDTKVQQTLLQRIVGLGNISVMSTDASGDFVLEFMPDAISKREQIRSHAKKARETKGVRTMINE